MAKTIIQTIGPLYGEVVNGTVFGRPNGSIYVPPTNKISLSIGAEYIVNGTGTRVTWLYPANAAGTIVGPVVACVAEAQDIASYMAFQVSTSSDFTTYDETSQTAGIFNVLTYSIITNGTITVVDEATYYVRAVLYSSSGVPVAYSEVTTLTGVAE